jgi:Subtilase family
MEREYVVTLKDYSDLEGFYDDMETPGGNLYIPGREVECALRREISRNTHYMLTDEEAEEVGKDPRVLACELLPKDRGIEATPYWDYTGNFEKSSTFTSNDKNWGILRCTSGYSSGWGTDGGATTQKTGFRVRTTSSGKNVDVVIVDAHVNPNHLEFAKNPDGSGGGRVNTIDWFGLYKNDVGVSTGNSYDYSSFSSNHGTHVAGTACGNTQGWARDANIYSIEFNYSGSPVAQWDLVLFDFIRAFHRKKPTNPETGRKNPTITNNSWGYSYSNVTLSSVTSVTYRGNTTDLSGLTTEQKKDSLETLGVPVPFNTYLYKIPARVAALDADIQDAINEGIIVVASAGNSYWNCVDSSSPDYNNSIVAGATYYHSRGSSPAAADNVICVGSVGTNHIEQKSNFSNWGPRVDIWAPGSNIISAVYNTSAASEFGITLQDDPRSSTYKLGSISGTSMAGPQVCGVLACLMEQEQGLTQSGARIYLQQKARTLNDLKLQEPNSDWVDGGSRKPTQSPYTSLSSSDNNRFLFVVKERELNGAISPRCNHQRRPTSGVAYPRTRRRR